MGKAKQSEQILKVWTKPRLPEEGKRSKPETIHKQKTLAGKNGRTCSRMLCQNVLSESQTGTIDWLKRSSYIYVKFHIYRDFVLHKCKIRGWNMFKHV